MKKIIFLLSVLTLVSCKKEKKAVYGLNDVDISQNSANKDYLKSTTEFISIAYSDIFGTVISINKLADLTKIYKAFGDKKLIEQMVIKNFLNEPSIQIPQIDRSSASTINTFTQNMYIKLYNRTPDEYELWFISNMIENDTDLTSELIYFSLMTANEYRYY
ncbi:MAG: hypothetical protein HOJ77_07285 [Flavobacteriales bacterium]|jgi:hypothetical protein|nr:hypothetical protein [Flavobacteriales bacterium]